MLLMAHIAGVPVEETALALAPVGTSGLALGLAAVVHRLRALKGVRERDR